MTKAGDGESPESPRSSAPDATEEGQGTPPGRGAVSGDPAAAAPTEEVFYCDLCGNVMLNLHCKLICERCGYKRDCSDP